MSTRISISSCFQRESAMDGLHRGTDGCGHRKPTSVPEISFHEHVFPSICGMLTKKIKIYRVFSPM